SPHLHFIDPLGYIDFLSLEREADLVITDSGGVQEETTFLGVPCLTVRRNTERPITLSTGTNVLVGDDVARLRSESYRVLEGARPTASVPALWDGNSGARIADVILKSRIEMSALS